jgi:hypothetical protein
LKKPVRAFSGFLPFPKIPNSLFYNRVIVLIDQTQRC